MQDCLDILAGKTGFYTDAMVPAAVNADAEAHPYYVRTAAPDEWLKQHTADTWDNGVVTGAVNTYEMLAWARTQQKADPTCFIAGIR